MTKYEELMNLLNKAADIANDLYFNNWDDEEAVAAGRAFEEIMDALEVLEK